ncbi:MAG: substrate-binding domain-containing protein, partial [Chloroflexota bacterium]|nr:substrate-binding domain-containing protein [Chloroflexota bacterium]
AVAGTTAAVAAQDDAQFCKDTSIVFFPGGPEGGGFATVVYNGAKAAEALFGADVVYSWSDWDPAKMITQFGEAVATQPDGIAVMGHPGDDAFKPLIDDAVAQGIVVTVMNTELAATQAEHAPAGTGYVGATLYKAGHDLAVEAIKRGGLVEGDQAFLWGLLSQAGRGERTQGVKDGLEEAGIKVVYLEIDDATNADPAQGIPAFTGMASSNPDLKAAFFDHGNLTSTAQSYLEAAGMGPDDIYVAGFDLSPATIDAVKSGYTDLAIDQQQWLQGFEAIAQICLTSNYGFSGLHINTGGGFLDASNVESIEALVLEQIR